MRPLSREQNRYLSLYTDKIHKGHCMGLKMDVKSINQSQMDYVLYGLCPVAYSRRYRGLKGHGVCVYM